MGHLGGGEVIITTITIGGILAIIPIMGGMFVVDQELEPIVGLIIQTQQTIEET